MTQKKRVSSMEQMIDANLKRAFDDVLNQDIPDRFTDLLSQLRASEGADKGDDAAEDRANGK